MIFLKRFSLICLVAFMLFSCKQDSNTKNSIENNTEYAKFVNEMKAKGLSTGNVLVYENGKIIYKSSNGLQSIKSMDSLSLDSQFRLASVSKQFTGMAIMKLKEAGKLDYDQKVNTILTDFPYDHITIRQLLHHTSGLTDYERLIYENFEKKDSTKTYILGNDEILEVFYRVDPELDFQPGETYEYSNTGYLVLASIVEKVSGQHFKEFLKEQITDPIGMENTTLYKYQVDTDPKMPNRVFGYRMALNQRDYMANDYDIVNDVRGDGGIYSTLEDLYKWNMALANHTIIPKPFLDEALSSGALNNGEKTNYGFGWFIDSEEGKPLIVSHSGGWVGFATYLQNDLDAKSGFVILTNDSGENFGPVLRAVEAIRDGEPYEILKPRIRKVLAKKIYDYGIDKAMVFYEDLKSTSADDYAINENELNTLGYQLLQEHMVNESLVVFKLNTVEYPKSANVYDSYGDALLEMGDSLQALDNFQKAFKMDSTLDYSKEKSESLEKALKMKE